MLHIRLRELRESQGMTQKQLAQELKISRSSLSAYELNAREPDFSILKDIAKYFNVTVDYLLGLESQSPKKDTKLYDEIENLNDDSKRELKKYVELLKVNEIYTNEKNNVHYNRKNAIK